MVWVSQHAVLVSSTTELKLLRLSILHFPSEVLSGSGSIDILFLLVEELGCRLISFQFFVVEALSQLIIVMLLLVLLMASIVVAVMEVVGRDWGRVSTSIALLRPKESGSGPNS